jgi:hypothetical protein
MSVVLCCFTIEEAEYESASLGCLDCFSGFRGVVRQDTAAILSASQGRGKQTTAERHYQSLVG